MRKPFVAGNWKMNGSLAANGALLQAVRAGAGSLSGVEVAVCPPAVFLAQVAQMLDGSTIAWGSQNVSEHASGAYTGELSASMLREFGCSFAIVGHSERRALFGEDDRVVAEKAASALAGGLTPIVCVGETLSERDSGATLSVVERQLAAVIERIGTVDLARIVVAYEPVWAIGTGRTATPEQAQEVHAAIRRQLSRASADAAAQVRILYGGSVKPANAAEIFSMTDVDGGLIGGASLSAADFMAICTAAAQKS
ncbi:MAG TPA: triose-phosphate isomerase [Rhodocyclaceae bacterium]